MNLTVAMGYDEEDEETQQVKEEYRTTIGRFLYLVFNNRPDITVPGSVLGKFVKNHTQNYVKAA